MTICTHQREWLFGEIVGGETPQGGNVELNQFGKIADECWRAIPEHFPHVCLGAYVIISNHVHGIIIIHAPPAVNAGAEHTAPLPGLVNVKSGSLGANIGSFKSAVTRRIGREYNVSGIWQRNYHDRIIRDDREFENTWRYIEANSANWDEDTENLSR